MYAGRLVETGSVDDVFYRPRMPYTLGLIASLPRVDEGGRERLTPIVGAPPSLLNLPKGCSFTPRCPLAQPVCDEVDPELLATEGAAHFAACHFSEVLAERSSEELFVATSVDTESLTAVELLAMESAAADTATDEEAQP
jgi:oligopeptide/dipeptide ABC transporter ATP-binding protein